MYAYDDLAVQQLRQFWLLPCRVFCTFIAISGASADCNLFGLSDGFVVYDNRL